MILERWIYGPGISRRTSSVRRDSILSSCSGPMNSPNPDLRRSSKSRIRRGVVLRPLISTPRSRCVVVTSMNSRSSVSPATKVRTAVIGAKPRRRTFTICFPGGTFAKTKRPSESETAMPRTSLTVTSAPSTGISSESVMTLPLSTDMFCAAAADAASASKATSESMREALRTVASSGEVVIPILPSRGAIRHHVVRERRSAAGADHVPPLDVQCARAHSEPHAQAEDQRRPAADQRSHERDDMDQGDHGHGEEHRDDAGDERSPRLEGPLNVTQPFPDEAPRRAIADPRDRERHRECDESPHKPSL